MTNAQLGQATRFPWGGGVPVLLRVVAPPYKHLSQVVWLSGLIA